MSTHNLDREDEEEVARPAKRSRVLVACQRCKGRRQKCDNAVPACSNCARSKTSCTYPENAYPTSYVKQLEDRVGILEARLRDVDPSQASDHMDTNDQTTPQMTTPSSVPGQPSSLPAPTTGLASGMGLLSSCAAAEPHYFGFSSGLTLAHFVEAAIGSGSNASAINLPSLADRPFSHQVPTAQTPQAPVPTRSLGSKMIKAYLSTVHPLYPFLDEDNIWQMHRTLTNDASDSVSGPDLARLHLIYAIGSRCIQLLKPRKVKRGLPEEHLMSAMQHIPEALKFTSIHGVEITLLLAIHSMRSPSGASVWHLCGLAMRQCLELGLHRPRPHQVHLSSLEQRRRRLFWSVYIFERKSALVLGRPFAVSDKDIETLPPSTSDSTEVFGSPAVVRQPQDTWLTVHRHHIYLYRIHSKIRSALRCLKDTDRSHKTKDKVAACLKKLDDWKDNVHEDLGSRLSLPSSEENIAATRSSSDSSESDDEMVKPFIRSANLDRAELMLEFHKARRSLLQPLLTESGSFYTPTVADFAACADASGQICQLYRQLHRISALPFTLRDLHAVFIAGFTSIYCMATKPALYTARRASEIGACSTVLYVITEQWSSASRYRDAFEAVAERLVELVSRSENTETRNARDSYEIVHDSALAQIETRSIRRDNGLPPNDVQPQETVQTSSTFCDGNIGGDLSLFDSNTGYDEVRELLLNEGLDWFSGLDWLPDSAIN
ncbi:hypothetical protein AUEXF2481DRAFT_4886 [Aureobasidium subglaciale EXF-2481]|uniref:Zn(2)-C6 fungal-type domain-containing protein n=1 Tax=Aureobasidium subglaciale (strain EXF-2481) TaxID=1043005 RepID=A0A074Z8W5_AURSE|nr:uncharacterized protein AUEXF2481DRAFT_4886 [Aureobasidium subglaciale EXF-2481]KAI5195832.1 hypothetical protein E4T38_08837 [Aureobasidium subglaciale]KAI5214738.1 hypothetical protein E4T40_08794 [Aureobasidium subglaciale]KAI5217695.1 hypothetical protein E4T41_08704 [Aureobasidium subglaciale]KAI5255362.1 hypothetical protein E4T46_08738 [Aureobasidium subglaciale]KEQ95266.1 hypothetical protein AUEXF2481DRAFT_4886 [Aureobasidium subglaciale EXF-2481]